MARTDNNTQNNDFMEYVNGQRDKRKDMGIKGNSAQTISSNGQGKSLGEDTAELRFKELEDKIQNLTQTANLFKNQLDEEKQKSHRLQQHIDAKDGEKNEQAVNDVLSGDVNTFKKHYSFNVMGGEPEEFDIEMKPLSAVDMSNLQQKVVAFTNARGKYFDDDYIEIVEAVQVFQVAAIRCPDWLKDPSQIYRVDIPTQIYSDYLGWLESFRQSNKH